MSALKRINCFKWIIYVSALLAALAPESHTVKLCDFGSANGQNNTMDQLLLADYLTVHQSFDYGMDYILIYNII